MSVIDFSLKARLSTADSTPGQWVDIACPLWGDQEFHKGSVHLAKLGHAGRHHVSCSNQSPHHSNNDLMYLS
jgi:hypothetical protein